MSTDNMEKEDQNQQAREGVEAEENAATAEESQTAEASADEGAPAAEPSGETVGGDLSARVAELEAEVSELKDRYLRKQADFENFRKRMAREKQTAVEFSNKQLLLDIVTIIDDFERAIKSAEESKDFDAFHNGVLLIEKQFTSMLERKWGLTRFDSVGEEFDPQKHEAVATEESPDHGTAVVVEDYQKGYYLHDKVLRSAKVKVSMPAVGQADADRSE
jgi:molecular chaperone GrpE